MKAHIFLPIVILLICSCQKESILPSLTESENLGGLIVDSKWLVTRYDNMANGNVYEPLDTLCFISESTYSINGGVLRSYKLGSTYTESQLQITLKDCSTLGGTYRGLILKTFMQDEEINNALMDNIYTEVDLAVWLEQI